MKNKSSFLFLYTELAKYITSCIEHLSKLGEVHIINYPVNKEAPFQFQNENKSIFYYDRFNYNTFELNQLIDSINPDIIFCSGWIDKEYLKICKKFKKKIPTVLCMDTKWKGDFRQQFASIFSPFLITNKFSYAWVPGQQQVIFAQKLGIKPANIKTGYYCADINLFNDYFNLTTKHKNQNFPKRFLYVGRYYDFKGIQNLWDAFVQLQQENPNEWELWCLGNGDLKPVNHTKIKHFGFKQPEQLLEIISGTGVFILPSLFEPWGVVVQEYATAGYPLILSDQVGAAESFLSINKNGQKFKSSDTIDLKEKMKMFINLPNETLTLMSKKSHELGNKITISDWCKTAIEFLKK
jgi:glycosyltransferase involved in cell wall biosynthesis